jgi:hypothetical protein
MPKDELEQVLRSKAKTHYKRRLLLTQIGYLLINLFSEYYERLQNAEGNKEFEKAVELMNNYIENIAVTFIPKKRQSKFRKRMNAWVSDDTHPDPAKYLREWATHYEAWTKHTEAMFHQQRGEEFAQLKTTSFTVYVLSFSASNFHL